MKGSLGCGLLFRANSDLCLTAFTDSDWTSFQITWHFTTDYFIHLGSSPISWRCKKQDVFRSSAETEYWAMTTTTCEIV